MGGELDTDIHSGLMRMSKRRHQRRTSAEWAACHQVSNLDRRITSHLTSYRRHGRYGRCRRNGWYGHGLDDEGEDDDELPALEEQEGGDKAKSSDKIEEIN
jgi:hypothetical protein